MPGNDRSNPFLNDLLLSVFGDLSADQLKRILQSTEIVRVDLGEFLFKQGEPGESFYIVASGRLRALRETAQGTKILGDISRGEPVGEFAFASVEPRSASVIATRDSTVMKLDRENYMELVSSYPEFALMLTRFVINRMRRNHLEQHQQNLPRSVALVILQPDTDLSQWATDFHDQFARMGIDMQVNFPDSVNKRERADFFHDLEIYEGINFLVCSEADMAWSRQCLIYSDLVLVVSRSQADPSIYPIEEELSIYSQDILNKNIYLVLVHDENVQLPSGTREWLDKRNADLHIHIREKDERHIRRLARIIAQRANGIVFGGGGAKGLAHVGVVRAMYEEGFEIDVVGGTSAGALYGLGMAFLDFDLERALSITKDSAESKLMANDYNLPLISLMSGKKMKSYLKKMMGEADLEDFWITSYCVSADFSSSSSYVHTSGRGWKQIAASMAIPGVFPPVIIDHHLHLDGGVVDNLPIEPMFDYPVSNIIAVSLSGLSSIEVDIDEVPTAWALLWDKIFRRKKYRLPSLVSILSNSLILNSRQRQEQNKSEVSLYIELDLKEVGLLDDSKWKEIVEKGYRQMKSYLSDLDEEQRFW